MRTATVILVRLLRLLRTPILVAAVLSLTLLFQGGSSQTGPRSATANPYAFGVENSWIRVQNIGSADAQIEVQYYDTAGNLVARDVCPFWGVCPSLAPGSGWTFFQKNNLGLPGGFHGSAVVISDQPIVALVAKDVIRDTYFFQNAGDTVTVGPGSHRLYLPLVSNRDGPMGDWNGRFVIQNMSETLVCVTIVYLSNYTDSEIAWDPYFPLHPNPERLWGCPNGGRPIAANGSLFRDPETMGIGPGFTGSVRVDMHPNYLKTPTSNQFITGTADTWNSFFYPFASYRGFDEGELGTNVILPLVDREVGPGNQWSTHFQIENKDPTKPAQVTLRLEGWDMGANPPQNVIKENILTVNGARLCFQDRDDYANCLALGDRLPFNFVGTARLTSSQPIGVVVNRSSKFVPVFTDYRAFRPEDGARRVLLPVLNKNYGPYAGKAGWNSWFRIMVADGGAANVTIRYYGLDLPGGSVAYTVSIYREHTVFQYQEGLLPNGFAGSAVIESDRPIVALANLTTDVFTGDPDLLYNGISLP